MNVDCMACLVSLARQQRATRTEHGRTEHGKIIRGGVTHATRRRVLYFGTYVDERLACTNRVQEINWRTRWTSAVLVAMRSSTTCRAA